MSAPNAEYIAWLVERSMLNSAKRLAVRYAGRGHLWQRPYAEARPRDASALASVWFTAYPAAIITRENESVLRTLGDDQLWQALSAIGIQGLHTGPMKLAGGLRGREVTPTIDGSFDRISFAIDPAFGTQEEFVTMSQVSAAHHAVIIDDIVPAHIGKGADFHLATLHYEDYPGIYHMVEIAPQDWPLLPDVPAGREAVNLAPATVDLLRDKGYIVGQLRRVIFFEPGVKETDWSATGVIVGVDGVARRWVYLHYFKEGQPTLNWLDPSFAAARLVIGDALHSLEVLGAGGLRLDANGFLGIERRGEGPAWSEGHPLSVIANQIIAGMVRKFGGFTFQELNLTVDDIAAAKEMLILRRQTHLDQLTDKLREPRVQRIIEPLLAGATLGDTPTDDLDYVVDLGLAMRERGNGLQIANPIYREVIPRALTSATEASLPTLHPTWLTADNQLDPDRLLAAFLAFWRQHGQPLLKSAPYHEIAPHLVLMAFLHRVVNGNGVIEREYAIGSRRMALLVRYGAARLALELKVWRDGAKDPLTEGLAQLDGYLDGLGLPTGWLVIFDQRSGLPDIAERTTTLPVTTPAGRTVTLVRA